MTCLATIRKIFRNSVRLTMDTECKRRYIACTGTQGAGLEDTNARGRTMMTARKTEDGRPVIRLRCKPYARQPLKNWDMFVGHDGTVFVEYHGVDAEGPYTYWDSCHNLSSTVMKRAHKLAGYGR